MRRAQWDRRQFLRAAGAAGLAGFPWASANAEPPPETKRIRLIHDPSICLAPQYLAEELLRLEGFEQVEYVKVIEAGSESDPSRLLAQDKADFTLDAAPALVTAIDAQSPIAVLTGIHGGCYELFANDRVQCIVGA